MLNSAILSAIGAFGTILVAAPAAYAFSRIDFAGRRHLLLGVLALQMISPLVLAFPLYRYFASLGLLNNLPATGLVYIAILMPLATWMLKGFFDGIPKELDEAAMIDGANRWRAFVRVVLPIARPGLTAVFVIMALLAWAEFVIPYILLTGPSHLPIAVGILNFQGTYATNATGILAAGSVIAVLPGDPALRGAAALHRRRVHRRRAEGLDGDDPGISSTGDRPAIRVLARLRRPGRRPSTRPRAAAPRRSAAAGARRWGT